jgi:hypothetical protein
MFSVLSCRVFHTVFLSTINRTSFYRYSAPRARFAALYKPAAFDARRIRRDVRDRCMLAFRPDLYATASASAHGGVSRSNGSGTSSSSNGKCVHDLAAEPSAASISISTWASAVAPASALDYLPIAALIVRRRAGNQHAARLSQRLTPAQCQFLQDVCGVSRFGASLASSGRAGSAPPPFRTMKSIRQRSRALNEHRGLDDATDVDDSSSDSRGIADPHVADEGDSGTSRAMQQSGNHTLAATVHDTLAVANADFIEEDIEDV